MSFYYFYVLALLAIAAPTVFATAAGPPPRVKLVVLTTSYPRAPGRRRRELRRDGVEALRAEGLDVRVVSPASFRHFGIAYGDGIVNNLRRAPVEVPRCCRCSSCRSRARRGGRAVTRTSCTRTGCRARCPALATGKPFVLQLWGSDVALARRVRPLRASPRRPGRRSSSAPRRRSRSDARRLGARDVRVIPSRRRDPRGRRRAGRPAARALRRAALRGEGRAGARGGRARSAARRRR